MLKYQSHHERIGENNATASVGMAAPAAACSSSIAKHAQSPVHLDISYEQTIATTFHSKGTKIDNIAFDTAEPTLIADSKINFLK